MSLNKLEAMVNLQLIVILQLELPSRIKRERSIPRDFIDISSGRATKNTSYTTIELKKCNQRLSHAIDEIVKLSEKIIKRLHQDIAEAVDILRRASEALAFIDVLVSLTHYARSGSYIRPAFGASLDIKGGSHPLLDRREGTIPNDVDLTEQKCFMLLTGRECNGRDSRG